MKTTVNNNTSQQEGKWRLKIGSQIHGPYSVNQMRSLALQGMLAPHSQVSPADADEWHAASEEPDLTVFFHGTQSKFGQRSSAPASAPTDVKSESTNFLLIIDIKSDSNNELEQAIMRLGRASHVMRNAWILHGCYTAGTVRNALTPYLRPMDSLFIVDVNQGKTAAFNLGPEVEAKIRKIWKDDD